ncbi:MAG: 4-alpha-glucanotransferase [Puniceicoccales bacterium]|nr:4-alpha-glucanotransferase [Puniceicoccales bacterium]
MVSVAPILDSRRSGILLPLFSIPGRYGIGELGPAAMRWLDFMAECGQKIWQLLPINPTGFANSPYQSPSIMGCDTLSIGIEGLLGDGLLENGDIGKLPPNGSRIDYGSATELRMRLLRLAATRFLESGADGGFETFCAKEDYWLGAHGLFCALRERFGTENWTLWPSGFRSVDGAKSILGEKAIAKKVSTECALQYFFHRQWEAVRRRAASLSISIVGDMPIFASHGSVDVWANRDLFALDETGNPTSVAGVPPDYFSATGQRWGNPLYRWNKHLELGYGWWIKRMASAFEKFDAVRIDHFRAFADYWEIAAEEPTAVNGRWAAGPGKEFFRAAAKKLGPLPIIAEDLGILSNKAIALRDELDIPGLRILLFALDDYRASSPFLPENFPENCVAYSGTHDNDTAKSALFDSGEDSSRRLALLKKIMPPHYSKMHPIDGAIAWMADSKARWMILPMQDILHLGSEARTNRPSTTVGNWSWRLGEKQLESVDRDFLRQIARR